ncbi:MAG TPA: hypothetical protein VNE39_27720 [Planctomycetota bacterium]|nr:hypothetical protein [Planctomycetota bacterium]
MRWLAWACLFVALCWLGGCVYPVANAPQGATTTGILHSDFRVGLSCEISEPRKWTPIGRARGSTSLYSILGLFAWGDASSATAYDAAVRSVGADALVDYHADVTVYHVLGVYVCATTTISGLAVREAKGGDAK